MREFPRAYFELANEAQFSRESGHGRAHSHGHGHGGHGGHGAQDQATENLAMVKARASILLAIQRAWIVLDLMTGEVAFLL